MSTEEKWEKWEPMEGLQGIYYYIDSICNNKYGLKIILVNTKDKKKELHIIFDTGVYCLRETDNSYIEDKLIAVCKRQGEEVFISTNFFKVTNSEYVKWVSEQSRGISDYPPLEHLAIVTEDSVFEMLTSYRPKAELVDLS